MVINCMNAHVQFVGHLGGGEAFLAEVQHFHFTRSEAIVPDNFFFLPCHGDHVVRYLLRQGGVAGKQPRNVLAYLVLRKGSDAFEILVAGYSREGKLPGDEVDKLLLCHVGDGQVVVYGLYSPGVQDGLDDNCKQEKGQCGQQHVQYPVALCLCPEEAGLVCGFHVLEGLIGLLSHVVLAGVDVLLVCGGRLFQVAKLGPEHGEVVPCLGAG